MFDIMTKASVQYSECIESNKSDKKSDEEITIWCKDTDLDVS